VSEARPFAVTGARMAGRVCIVTGASSGIGRATALRLAAEGAHVVVADLQPEPRMALPDEHGTHEVIVAGGGSAQFVTADIRLASDVDVLISTAAAYNGRIDVVVNNAGRFNLAPILETSEEKWDEDMDLNVRSQFLMCKRVIAQYLTQDAIGEVRGRIVNVASQLGVTAPPNAVTYAVAKAGVAHLTRQLAIDFAREGVLVNAVGPGRILTGTHPGEREYLAEGTVDPAIEFSLKRTPFPRLGRPEDVAGAILFLSSDDATFISGHLLMVDGGWTAY
jgi:NAD(P)-dependent dehydrogenase (short-subunit alcohol dehydrogenase family)